MSRHHKKRIIQKHRYIINTTVNNILKTVIDKENITFKTMEQYYNIIIDSISNQIEIKKIIEEADNVIKMFSKKEEIFQILDTIETNVLSILCNIVDNTPVRIIECRIEYLRTIIEKLPEDYNNYGEFACMVYNIIDLITKEIDYKIVIENIDIFHNKLQGDVKLLDGFDELRDTLFSIIENIQCGTPVRIIECRIEYLKTLIDKIECN